MEPPSKKSKTEARAQTFLPEYTRKYPFMVKSKKEHHAYCTYCKCDLSIKSSGMFNLDFHVSKPKHQKNAKAASQASQQCMAMFTKKPDTEADKLKVKVMRAEVIMTELVAELNLSFASMDKLTKAFKQMFPDSKIAQEFSCARTKSTAIAKDIAKIHQEKLFKRMVSTPFTISTDGSNDTGSGKQFPLVVRTFDQQSKTVQSELLSIPTLHGSGTGEAIFNLIDETFKAHQVPWGNCIGLGCDNAPVMTGQKKGVYAFAQEKNPNLSLMGCTLHLVHIGAEKGAEALPVSAADLLTDIFYYLRKSSLRKHKLSELQWYHEEDQEVMLKHVPTRWLSISRCLERLLKHWIPLKSFFKIELAETKATSDSKVSLILRRLRSPSTQLYLHFLQYGTTLFQKFLTSMQTGEPKIHALQPEMQELFEGILVNFVKSSAVVGRLPQEVDYHNDNNIKCNDDIMIATTEQ